MYKREKYIITPLFIIFIYHGLLYYVFPEYHYLDSLSEEGWISYIKYGCLLLALPIAVSTPRYKLSWPVIGVVILFLPLVNLLFWPAGVNQLIMQFQAPILGYFFAPYCQALFRDQSVVKRHGLALLLISSVAVIFEYSVGGYFESFSRSGIRSTGPFVNPNNTGIIVALTASTIHFQNKNRLVHLLSFLCCLSVIVLTGSKTAAVVYAIGILLSQNLLSRLAVVPLLVVILAIYTYGIVDFSIYEDLRGISLESARLRMQDYAYLLNMAYTVSLTEFIFGFSSVSLADNAYIDIFSFGGVFILVFFLIIQIWALSVSVARGSKVLSVLFVLLFISMLSTNIPRLWPTAYAFWVLVGIMALRTTSAARAPAGMNLTAKDLGQYVYR